ncbi:MAG: hydroxymethylbilane synthase [Parachlamydiales bacterium]|jgi:hydroxymethylbilane synthase
MIEKVRLGTRGSKLALAQAEIVKSKFESLFPSISFEIQVVHTTGDLDLDSPLCEIGGKGVFIKELEVALKNRQVDIAVHSLKDITSAIPKELSLAAFLTPEAVTDVLIFNKALTHFDQLPKEAVIATGSLRRRALIKKLRPDIQFIDYRGNVLTRLQKLKEGKADALLLSEAGLIRLGLQDVISYRFSPYIFCPAPGQGVITLETRRDDPELVEICRAVNSPEQEIKSSTELACLEKVGFDCRIPLGIYSELSPDWKTITLIVFISSSTMDQFFEERIKFPVEERQEAAAKISTKLLAWKEQYD